MPRLADVLSPLPPIAPRTYSIPTPATRVTTTAELSAAMALGTPQTIVLANGVYENLTHISRNVPHRLYAENLLGAELRFGLTFGGNTGTPGGEIHGIRFNVSDVSRCDPVGNGTQKQVLLGWGVANTYSGTPGNNIVVEDCEFLGNDIIGRGINTTRPSGWRIRRCRFIGFQDDAMRLSTNVAGQVQMSRPIVEDIYATEIWRPVPGTNSGQSEDIIWTTHDCEIRRIFGRNIGFSGIALRDAPFVTMEDVDVDGIGGGYRNPGGVGIYFDGANRSTLERFRVGPNSMTGVNFEWDLGSQDPWVNTAPPRTYDNEIRHGFIESYKMGVHADRGAVRNLVEKIHVERAWRAGFLDNNRFPDQDNRYPIPAGQSRPIYSTNIWRLSTCSFRLAEGVPIYFNGFHNLFSAEPPVGWPATPATYDEAALRARYFQSRLV